MAHVELVRVLDESNQLVATMFFSKRSGLSLSPRLAVAVMTHGLVSSTGPIKFNWLLLLGKPIPLLPFSVRVWPVWSWPMPPRAYRTQSSTRLDDLGS